MENGVGGGGVMPRFDDEKEQDRPMSKQQLGYRLELSPTFFSLVSMSSCRDTASAVGTPEGEKVQGWTRNTISPKMSWKKAWSSPSPSSSKGTNELKC